MNCDLERCTDRVRKAIRLAENYAKEQGANYVGTEHVLVGLYAVDGVATNVMRSRGIDTAEQLQKDIDDLLGPKAKSSEQLEAELEFVKRVNREGKRLEAELRKELGDDYVNRLLAKVLNP